MALRIGLLTGEYPPLQGGVGAFSRELATALVDLGHVVHVITRVGCVGGDGNTTGLTVHPIVSRWGWRAYRHVMACVRSLDIDVLNIQYQAAAYDLHPAVNFYPWLTSLSCKWLAGLNPSAAWQGGRSKANKEVPHPPIVVTFHDLKVPYMFPKAGPLRDRAVISLARHADAAIVTNRADELTLTAHDVPRVERIPIGSNIAPSLPADYDRDSFRAQWNIGPDDFLLGFFGFFNARKGVETLIRALGALDTSFHLLFIGGTVGSSDSTNRAYADRMIALIAHLRLSERVHFTGYVSEDQVSAAFAAVDLCVLPYADGISFHHGTLMAALAHSQAIVSTQSRIDLPELVHAENVWLVPPKDPDALVAAIIALAANPIRRRRLAQGAAELSDQFSWERIAARTAELFESVIRE